MDEEGLEDKKWKWRISRGKVEIEKHTTKGEFH